jgi:hypothetical protein
VIHCPSSVPGSRRLIALLAIIAAQVPATGHAQSTDPEPAPEEAADVTPPQVEPGAEPEVEDLGLVKGLSWDLLGGGVPTSGAILQAEVGITGLPRVAYHYSLKQGLSVGGQVGLDWGHYHLVSPTVALELQAAVRYSVYRSPTLSIGLRADPGFYYNFASSLFGLLFPIGANVGYTVDDRIIVGGGVEVPMLLLFSGRSSGLALPLLFGPIAEYHLSPPLAITLDAKVGPVFNTGGGTDFGLKLMVGLGYRI